MHRKTLEAIVIIIAILILVGCGGGGSQSGSDVEGIEEGTEVLGRYMFDTPLAFTDVGTIDTPRMVADSGLSTIHLTYIMSTGNQQEIMYTRTENGEFRHSTYLSEREGQKRGGGYIFRESPDNLNFYWINVTATGGVLRYKTTSDGGRVFTMEQRWNQRNQPRWPCVLNIGGKTTAFYFLHGGDEWELVKNVNFSEEEEPTLLVADDIPFHLQGLTGGGDKVWLAYFTRDENADGGRIAFFTSKDRGESFNGRFLFDDRIIQNMSSFFSLGQSGSGNNTVIQLIFTEESPELTTVYYSRSTDGGDEFSTPVAVFTSENPLTRAPLLLLQGDYVMIATADTEDEGPALRYVFSEDEGETFTEPEVATRNVTSPETIAGVMGDDGSVVLAWDDLSIDSTGGEQLFRLKGTLRGN